MSEGLIIVGAGQASAEMASTLRQQGFAGRIRIFGDEPHLPYQRPPLSKGFLSGALDADALMLRTRAAYDRVGIELQLGARVTSIDRKCRRILLEDGRAFEYEKLALHLGGRARALHIDGAGDLRRFHNYHQIRTISDVQRLRQQFVPDRRLVVIGAGYIGLEVAAVAVKCGLHVTVLEAASRVLARVTGPEISAFYADLHRRAGVDVRTSVQLTAVDLDDGGLSVTAVRCTDGVVPLDLVVAGVGLTPNTELAAATGIGVEDGICVDQFGRTSDPDILAAGDCASHVSQLYERRVRLESTQNAVEQARAAALMLCGTPKPYASVPWFWSDQYDVRLQIVGLSAGYEQIVLRGSPDERSFAVFYLRNDRVIAADTVGRPGDFMMSKKLVAARMPVRATHLADQAIPLSALLATAVS